MIEHFLISRLLFAALSTRGLRMKVPFTFYDRYKRINTYVRSCFCLVKKWHLSIFLSYNRGEKKDAIYASRFSISSPSSSVRQTRLKSSGQARCTAGFFWSRSTTYDRAGPATNFRVNAVEFYEVKIAARRSTLSRVTRLKSLNCDVACSLSIRRWREAYQSLANNRF